VLSGEQRTVVVRMRGRCGVARYNVTVPESEREGREILERLLR
jgi:hypothetical protein